MSDMQFIITAVMLALATMATRYLPFMVFKDNKLPGIIVYLGKLLPSAMMGLLVIYSFKDFDFGSLSGALPPLTAGLAAALLHLWKRNTMLSIAVSTAVYMLLIRI